MSQRYLGGVITANPTAPTLASASGVWTLEQQFQYAQTIQPEIIGNSLRLRSSASAYLSRTPASAGNRRTFTISYWIKRGLVNQSLAQYLFAAGSGTTESTWFGDTFDTNGSSFDPITVGTWTTTGGTTNALFRDPSAWYHVVLSIDTTQATASNRCRIYVNGVLQSASTPTFTQNADLAWNNSGVVHYIGARVDSGPRMFFDGYIAEVYNIDGQALTPSSFGAYDSTGVWQPLAYTGTYGTNGFYLDFSDTSALTTASNVGLGKDYSGNGNYWVTNNISITAGTTYDAMIDSPTNLPDGTVYGKGNYAVLNPLNLQGSVTSGTITEANLKSNPSSSAGYTNYLSSIAAPSSGYWYAEFTVSGTYQGGNNNVLGIQSATSKSTTALGSESFSYGYWDGDRTTGSFRNNNTTSQSVAGFQTGDVLMVAFGNGNVWFGKNGTWLGTGSPNPATATSPAYSSLSGDFYIGYSSYGTSGVTYGYNSFANFGQRPFTYTPPTGFKALNTANLAAATINNGAQYFAATTYTGNGGTLSVLNSANNTIGTTFQPDFVWIKNRTTGATDHTLVDSVRGTNGTTYYRVFSDLTNAESANNANSVSALNSNGFTVIGTSPYIDVNENAKAFIGWQWKAAGSTVSNTAGSITSTVSANTTAGFSIVAYTGTGANATVGHGLGVAPKFIIFKGRSNVSNWWCYHIGLTSAAYTISLNQTAAQLNSPTSFQSTAPTSTVFYIGTDGGTNTSANPTIAYCFAEVTGYSKFGSYTGNASSDGPFVYCGFRPRYVMIKNASAVNNWEVYDTSRSTYNAVADLLYPNLSNAEGAWPAGTGIDVLSNGFKIRRGDADLNGSGNTLIYAAFAENPFTISRAR